MAALLNYFQIKSGNTLPALETRLLSGGAVVDLSAATSVVLRLLNRASGALAFTRSCVTFQRINPDTQVLEWWVRYLWQPGETAALGVEVFDAEFEVFWGTDSETFPNSGFATVSINKTIV